ncbi:hypothetical protein LEP1GSC065_1223 [Leptospira kirschneri serovar Sokoine str. RM1]|nr:hypothetical protein LEP1GSC065_1223 [Leptospira kirschneri serovar Sokoine str. RM1]
MKQFYEFSLWNFSTTLFCKVQRLSMDQNSYLKKSLKFLHE